MQKNFKIIILNNHKKYIEYNNIILKTNLTNKFQKKAFNINLKNKTKKKVIIFRKKIRIHIFLNSLLYYKN